MIAIDIDLDLHLCIGWLSKDGEHIPHRVCTLNYEDRSNRLIDSQISICLDRVLSS